MDDVCKRALKLNGCCALLLEGLSRGLDSCPHGSQALQAIVLRSSLWRSRCVRFCSADHEVCQECAIPLDTILCGHACSAIVLVVARLTAGRCCCSALFFHWPCVATATHQQALQQPVHSQLAPSWLGTSAFAKAQVVWGWHEPQKESLLAVRLHVMHL